MSKKEWISNWLISNTVQNTTDNRNNYFSNNKFQTPIISHSIERQLSSSSVKYTDNSTKNSSKIHKNPKKNVLKKTKNFTKIIEESELTVSPVSGTFIIKEWNNKLKNKFIREQEEKNVSCKKKKNDEFTNDEIMLNSVASNYVQITDEAKNKISKIVNCIGPYECKLCKIVYNDAFELAMHNCPRVVHFEYK
jgi:hypothetical protein